jgi:hypothetical protein
MEEQSLPLHLRSVLEPDEEVRIHAASNEGVFAVTTRRVVIADPARVALAVPFERLRRIQFDIERGRPATLVIVPEHPLEEPQVLSIPPDHYQAAAQAIVAVGQELAG